MKYFRKPRNLNRSEKSIHLIESISPPDDNFNSIYNPASSDYTKRLGMVIYKHLNIGECFDYVTKNYNDLITAKKVSPFLGDCEIVKSF